MPVDGTIVETNSKLDESPELMNESPEDDAGVSRFLLVHQKI